MDKDVLSPCFEKSGLFLEEAFSQDGLKLFFDVDTRHKFLVEFDIKKLFSLVSNSQLINQAIDAII